MLDNLTDEDIIDYLMTSDFTDGLTPDELKFLLFKFRNFYRLCNGRNETFKIELNTKMLELKECKSNYEDQINRILIDKANIENNYNLIKSRKLSFMERWLGKIIIKEKNEN
jgi:hypothetical protein